MLGIAVYIMALRIVFKGHRQDLIAKANAEGENIKQQKILQAKEKFVQLKSEHESYVNKRNAELRERENNIRAKETQLNQQAGDLKAKLRAVENQKN